MFCQISITQLTTATHLLTFTNIPYKSIYNAFLVLYRGSRKGTKMLQPKTITALISLFRKKKLKAKLKTQPNNAKWFFKIKRNKNNLCFYQNKPFFFKTKNLHIGIYIYNK